MNNNLYGIEDEKGKFFLYDIINQFNLENGIVL